MSTTAIEHAVSSHLALGNGISLWYRIWGSPDGIPVLFVHGGPGQCVADYDDVNARFFDADKFHVVEVDQRGTGLSQPSVRDDFRHMARYSDISLAQMAGDFERVREAAGIERWLIFGGSWGSTLGLEYALTYPSVCLGLILRGIFLNTVTEMEAIYARKSFVGNARRLAEFDTFFELASNEVKRRGEAPLDPDDAERFVRVYEELITSGDRHAIWRFYVFENNIIEEDETKMLDPRTIHEPDFAEAQSVAFFEARLFLRGTYEAPVNLLGDRLSELAAKDGRRQTPQLAGTDPRTYLASSGVEGAIGAAVAKVLRERPPDPLSAIGRELRSRGGTTHARPAVRTWVAQGTGDEICPVVFAQQLVSGLQSAGVPHTAYFFNAGHSAQSDAMSKMLRRCVDEFVAGCPMASERREQ